MSDAIRVNGNLHSWGSIILKLDGERYTGFSAISYGDKRERAKGYGMGRHQAPRGRSRGKYSTEPVKLTGSKASVQVLREALAAQSENLLSYGDVQFEIVVQFIEEGETPMNVNLERCVFVGDASSNSEGADALNDEIEIDCMLIRRNGKTLFDSTQGIP